MRMMQAQRHPCGVPRDSRAKFKVIGCGITMEANQILAKQLSGEWSGDSFHRPAVGTKALPRVELTECSDTAVSGLLLCARAGH